MLAIVVSRADEAAEHIGDKLLELGDWTERTDESRPAESGGGTYYRREGIELRTIEELHLHTEGIASCFEDPDLLVFASRHSGETGKLLTAHATGNFGPAEYGGDDRALATAAPGALSRVRTAFAEYAPPEYEAGIECTHHGPTDVGCPSLFVELGSGPEAYDDPAGAEAVARSILALADVEPMGDRAVVGFGGGHYAPRFDRVLTETDWGVGHVAAEWCTRVMNEPIAPIIEEAFERSDAEYALLDGADPEIEAAIEELGFETVTETWLQETTGVPLSLVEAVEAKLSPIDSGLRLGTQAVGYGGPFVVRNLPPELLSEADGIDREQVRSVLEAEAVAFETREGASRVGTTACFRDDASRSAVIEELATILESKYSEVTVREDAVVASRTAFDPGVAKKLGVEEGPAFGRLSSGQPVDIGGETIEPSDVHRNEERFFPI
ncbi:MAG: D-aminoacyl-tRNA deacylase [Natronomonas sp.]